MKRNSNIFVGVLAVLLVGVAGIAIAVASKRPVSPMEKIDRLAQEAKERSPQSTLERMRPVTQEITEESCKEAGGRWNACGSACRGSSEPCIQMCVPMCECGGTAQYTCPANTECANLLPTKDGQIGVCTHVVEATLYRNFSCGFVMRVLPEWNVEDVTGATVISKGEAKVQIGCASEIPGIPVTEDRIRASEIDGESAKQYQISSLRDGAPEVDIRVRHPVLPLDVSVRGTPALVEEVAKALVWKR